MTISTALSLSRIALIVPFWHVLASGETESRWWAFLILVAAIVTDFLDGFIARRLHQVTDFGKIVDPVADKVGVGIVAVALAVNGDIPWWYVWSALTRDLLILAGGVYIKRTKDFVTQSNWPGKIAVTAIAVYLLMSVLLVPSLESVRVASLWISVALMVYSLGIYAQRLSIGRNVKRNGE